MKTASDSLFRLVHSLDSSERGYVKKFMKRNSEKGNANLHLFTALEQQTKYNEAALRKKFKNFAVVKVHTWDEIMDALRLYHKNNMELGEIYGIFTEIELLTKKGFKEDAYKICQQYIDLSYKKEDFLTLISLLSALPLFYNQKNTKKPYSEFFFEIFDQIISAIDKLKETYEYEGENGKLFYLQQNPKTENYVETITAFKNNSVLFHKQPSSTLALLRYYNLHSLYYAAIGDSVMHIEYLEKFNEAARQRAIKLNYREEVYYQSNWNLMATYTKHKQFDKLQKQIDILQKDRDEDENKGLKIRRDTGIYYYQLTLYNRTLQLKALKSYIEKNNNTLTALAHNQLSVQSANLYKINYLISLLLLQKHTEALRWIMECDNDKTFRTGDTDYQLVLYIKIILNYVLGDSATAQREAKKYAKDKKYRFAPLFKALAVADKAERENKFTEAVKSIKETETNSETLQAFLLSEYFDVSAWAASVLK